MKLQAQTIGIRFNMRINFSEWLPDQPATVDSLKDATNVVPLAIGYGSFPLAVNYSNAAAENLYNVVAGRFNNTTTLFAGGATKLFKFDGATLSLTDVSKVGGYTASDWEFTQFGNTIIAANNNSKLQAWTLSSSTAFADLSVNAPIAKYVTTVRDFVVAANLDGGLNSNKVQWSDINDETDWVSGATSQSDFQIISDGGNITGITGGEFGIIFLERAIVRMSYIGSPYFFQFDTIARNIGCVEGGSVAQYAGMSFFLSDNGFYSCDGHTVTPIGNEKVDRYFYTNVDVNKMSTMSCAVDPIKKLVVWNYPTISNTRALLIYNYSVQKWSVATTDVNYIASAATSGLTLEGLDIYGTLDSLTTSLDDRLWAGGKYLFAGVRADKIITFTGNSSSATITTSDIEQGYNSVVTLARPQIDNGSCTVSVASRKNLSDTITFSSPSTTSSEGRAPLRSHGRYHRFKVQPTGNWSSMIGLDADFADQGNR